MIDIERTGDCNDERARLVSRDKIASTLSLPLHINDMTFVYTCMGKKKLIFDGGNSILTS